LTSKPHPSSLPPLLTTTQEARDLRSRMAFATVAALLPANVAEANFAAC
jgi:hypothetical protein